MRHLSLATLAWQQLGVDRVVLLRWVAHDHIVPPQPQRVHAAVADVELHLVRRQMQHGLGDPIAHKVIEAFNMWLCQGLQLLQLTRSCHRCSEELRRRERLAARQVPDYRSLKI